MQKAIVTGATGLVGSHLIAELIKTDSFDVTAMIRSENSLPKLLEVTSRYGINKVNYLISDMVDYSELRTTLSEYDVVFHCAATVSFDGTNAEKIVWENVELTHYVVESCLSSTKSPLLVHVSSIAALGQSEYPEPVAEESLFSNIITASPYSRSKFLSENEVWRGIKQGLNAVIISPSVILGVGSSNSTGLRPLFKMAQKGIPFYTSGINGFVDVLDVVRAMRILAQNRECWNTKYIVSGHNLEYKELVSTLNNSFGNKNPRILLNKSALRLITYLSAKLLPKYPITTEMLGFLTNRTIYDSSRLISKIGFEYTPINKTFGRVASEFSKQK